MFIPSSSIDILFDYIPLLTDHALCKIPTENNGKEVAIIGAGAAGIIVAHELLKMGLKPVIYEASGRLGGRLYSKPFQSVEEDNKPFGEMGAMRIPASSRIFFHYAKKLGLDCNVKFPAPGKVATAIYYRNKLYHWVQNQNLPEPFNQIKKLWELFSIPLVSQIHQEWQQGNLENVKLLWQAHIHQYKDKSFYEVLRERTPISNQDQLSIFGALGIGGGGFSALFQISFLEILRLLANDYIHHQALISQGVSEFVNRLYTYPVKTPSGNLSLADLNTVKLRNPVILIDYNLKTRNPIIHYKDEANNVHKQEYDAVVFTGSMCAAHLINIVGKTKSGVYLLTGKEQEAVKNSPMIASSKTFICTKSKFWLEKNIPPCILMDDLPRATAFLDYPQTKHGVVCLSYTWGMDATKLHAVDPKDRVIMFRRVMESLGVNISKELEPMDDEVLNIDWINEKYQNGAFKIFTPGNDARQRELYFQFQSVLTPDDKGLYLAGDSISWSGGWVEGALYTAINAVYAVAKRFKAEIPSGSPLEQRRDLYEY